MMGGVCQDQRLRAWPVWARIWTIVCVICEDSPTRVLAELVRIRMLAGASAEQWQHLGVADVGSDLDGRGSEFDDRGWHVPQCGV